MSKAPFKKVVVLGSPQWKGIYHTIQPNYPPQTFQPPVIHQRPNYAPQSHIYAPPRYVYNYQQHNLQQNFGQPQHPSLQSMRSKLNLVGQRFYKRDYKTQQYNSQSPYSNKKRVHTETRKSKNAKSSENIIAQWTEILKKMDPAEREKFEQNKQKLVLAATPKVEQLWRRCLNDRKLLSTVPVNEAAEYLLNSKTHEAILASHSVLLNHDMYFRHVTNGEFECKSEHEVESWLKRVAERYRDAQFLLYLIDKLPEAERNREEYIQLKNETEKLLNQYKLHDKIDNVDIKSLEEELKTYALGLTPQPWNGELYKRVLQPLGYEHSIESAFQLCKNVKLFDIENIHLLRKPEWRTPFPKDIEELALKMKNDPSQFPDHDKHIRQDLRHLKVFAIDEFKETDEVDDAVSIVECDDGTVNVYVHIADATRFIGHHEPMDKIAFQRVSSIYLPEMKIPMLPKALSVELLSLSSEKENYTLTFMAQLDSEGQILNYNIFPAIVSKVIRLDYDEADETLSKPKSKNEDSTTRSLRQLLKVANTRLAYRLKQGASAFHFPKSIVKVENGNIIMKPSKEYNSYTRRIVEECMVIANEISAKFANDNGIVIPYRATMGGYVQNQIHSLQDLDINTNMTQEEFAKKMISNLSKMTKQTGNSCITQIPTFHSGLGVSAYTQVTSPIRRYTDLLVHHQLKAHLRGKDLPWTWQQITELLQTMEIKKKEINNLQRDSERFWSLKYFSLRLGKIYKALVLEQTQNYNMVLNELYSTIYLFENGYRTKVKMEQLAQPGDIIHVKVVEANPYKDELVFEHVTQTVK